MIGGAAAFYLVIFDPVSLRVHPLFRYAGAGIPAVMAAGLVYFIAMRVVGVRHLWSTLTASTAATIEVTL